ncbi:MAG: hypothetical protein EXR99_02895 [Gemmataceae bacterium]|nr:hypothetical protein [Gemmataceae bacterium]
MKKTILTLCLCTLGLTGCVTLPEWDQAPSKQEVEKTRGLGNDKIPVTVEQITEENSARQLIQLTEEISRAEREPVLSSPENN